MPAALEPHLQSHTAERLRFYNELGIYDFYRHETSISIDEAPIAEGAQLEIQEEMTPKTANAKPPLPQDDLLSIANPKPEAGIIDRAKALKIIREDIGDCTRCVLHKQGRKQIVFGVGNPN